MDTGEQYCPPNKTYKSKEPSYDNPISAYNAVARQFGGTKKKNHTICVLMWNEHMMGQQLTSNLETCSDGVPINWIIVKNAEQVEKKKLSTNFTNICGPREHFKVFKPHIYKMLKV